MLSIRKGKKRAKRGAKWLDYTHPEWFLTVDLDCLAICSEDRCMGAQVCGDGDYSYSGLGEGLWALRHGFLCGNKGDDHVYIRAWSDEVIARRDAFNEKMAVPSLTPAQAELPSDTQGSTL